MDNSPRKHCTPCQLAPLLAYTGFDIYTIFKYPHDIWWLVGVILIGLLYLHKSYKQAPLLKLVHIVVMAITLIILVILNH